MNKYELLIFDSLIGHGSQAQVVKCKKLGDDSILAAKMINKQQMKSILTKLIMNEKNVIKKLYSLNNKNLINIHEVIEDEKQITLIMDYYQRGDLDKEILQRKKKNRYYKAYEIIDFIFQIIEGFYQIFLNQIIHRDLKPSNIFLKEENNQITYIIGDFGISRIVEDISMQKLYTQVFTQSYQSPQSFFGKEYSGKTDVFSFGLVILELIFLQKPFIAKEEQSNFYKKLENDKLQIKDLNFIEGNDKDKQFIQFILQKTLAFEESDRMDWRDLKKQKELYLNVNLNQKAQEDEDQKLKIQKILPKTESKQSSGLLDLFLSNSILTQKMKQYFNNPIVLTYLDVSEINKICYNSALDYFQYLNLNSAGAIYYQNYQQFSLQNYITQEQFSKKCLEYIESFDEMDAEEFNQWYKDMEQLNIKEVISQCVEKINSLKIRVNQQFHFRDFISKTTNDYFQSYKFIDQFFNELIMKRITLTKLNLFEIPEDYIQILFYSFKINDEIQQIEQQGVQSTFLRKKFDFAIDDIYNYLLDKQDLRSKQMMVQNL